MSALSNMVTPASKQMSSRRRASATSVAPHAWKNSPLPPNVPVPKLNTGTLKPEAPRKRCSISHLFERRFIAERTRMTIRHVTDIQYTSVFVSLQGDEQLLYRLSF